MRQYKFEESKICDSTKSIYDQLNVVIPADENKITLETHFPVLPGKQRQSQYPVDLFVAILGANGKMVKDADFIFYSNPSSYTGAICLRDDYDGPNFGTCAVHIEIDKIPDDTAQIQFGLSIYLAKEHFQSFSHFQFTRVRLFRYAHTTNLNEGITLLQYDLHSKSDHCEFLELGSLTRDKKQWIYSPSLNCESTVHVACFYEKYSIRRV